MSIKVNHTLIRVHNSNENENNNNYEGKHNHRRTNQDCKEKKLDEILIEHSKNMENIQTRLSQLNQMVKELKQKIN